MVNNVSQSKQLASLLHAHGTGKSMLNVISVIKYTTIYIYPIIRTKTFKAKNYFS